jgi:hypothetical protein
MRRVVRSYQWIRSRHEDGVSAGIVGKEVRHRRGLWQTFSDEPHPCYAVRLARHSVPELLWTRLTLKLGVLGIAYLL